MSLILVDTCIWAPFFNRPNSIEKKAVDQLLDEDSAALIGPILAEILHGIPNEGQAKHVASLLRGVRYLETGWGDWQEAARIGRSLARRGHKLPLSDLVLAAVATRLGAEIYTVDPHFELIREVKRFENPIGG